LYYAAQPDLDFRIALIFRGVDWLAAAAERTVSMADERVFP
jgi:hypothetical protein